MFQLLSVEEMSSTILFLVCAHHYIIRVPSYAVGSPSIISDLEGEETTPPMS